MKIHMRFPQNSELNIFINNSTPTPRVKILKSLSGIMKINLEK